MSFGDHLDELRKRLMLAILVPVPVFAALLYFGNFLIEAVTAPVIHALKQAHQPAILQVTNPVESFTAYMKVAAVGTLIIALPWMLYQLWLFVAPGLYQKEKRFVRFLVPMSALLTLTGLAILYFVLLPLSLYCLINFGASLVTQHVPTAPLPEGITLPSLPQLTADPADAHAGQMWFNTALQQVRIAGPEGLVFGAPMQSGTSILQQYRLSEYVDLVFVMGLAFVVVSQLPLVMMFLSWIGIVRYEVLSKYRKHAIFGCVLGAAFLPTTDPGSLIMLGGMTYSLYELGLILMRFVPASRVARGVFKRSGTPPPPTPTGGDGHLGDE